MNRIQGKRVLITGASAGIGEACARAFHARGAALELVARREERLQHLKDELSEGGDAPVHIHALDVRNREEINRMVEELRSEDRMPEVLVNNAGLVRGLAKLHEADPDTFDEVIDTNVKGLLYLTRALLPSMVERNQGHVVNLGSIAGRMVYPGGNVYNATKFAVRALTHATNVDLVGTRVRASTIDPGAVETEFSLVRFRGDEERAAQVYQGFDPLGPEDVADAICYVVNAPQHVNIQEMLIMPTDQRNPYVRYRDED